MGFAFAQPILRPKARFRLRPSALPPFTISSFGSSKAFACPQALRLQRVPKSGSIRGNTMRHRNTLCAVGLALIATCPVAQGFDDAKYPDLSGLWVGVRIPGLGGQPGFDPTKPWGRGQQAPLTPEYQAVLEASLADQARGGQGNWKPGADCLPPGMPGMMTLFQPAEFIVLPEITYIRIDHVHDSHRRIYTDGRDWPQEVEPSFLGYSIGRWIDETGEGRFNELEVETRHFKGPRALDPAGMPVQADNQSIRIGQETYYRGGDGHLMPTRKDQPPPDLRYFKQTRK